ncbi:hypothetical protein Hypma_008172 [Hypsizygus marmoreus]|uniref:Uncharacterized protein n=1 Tax=Hypsizygus marmoreus TaxID=39966 RepID=A0A369JZ16_HYPMA|nr:hypothetical protein Hypma_008172 [Hypsizygus marmoreus]
MKYWLTAEYQKEQLFTSEPWAMKCEELRLLKFLMVTICDRSLISLKPRPINKTRIGDNKKDE